MRGAVSLLALAAALTAPGLAFAAGCANIVAGRHAFAGPAEICVAPPGLYNPQPTANILPFADPGYGFLAYGDGKLSSRGAVTINEGNSGAAAVAASGAGVVTLDQGAAVNLLNRGAFGVLASAGGRVDLGATAVSTTVSSTLINGFNGQLMTSTGGSAINATNVAAGYGFSGIGVLADQTGAINYTGGSIAATGAFQVNAAAHNGATLTLRGVTLTTSGDGGNTLWASNGGTVDGANLTIRATGGTFTPQGVTSGGATNNGFGSTSTGGVLRLANSDIQTTQYGVFTADGGVTTLTDDSVAVSGANGRPVDTERGGQTTIRGGSYSTAGSQANTLFASGAGSLIDAGPNGTSALTVSSSGVASVNAQAFGGATINLNNAHVTASGDGSQGLWATSGGTINASGLTIDVTGEVDAGSGLHPGGASNNAFAPYSTSAGTLTIGNTTINVSGARGFGVYTAGGGVTALTNVVVAMTGADSVGVRSDTGGSTTFNGGGVGTSLANSPALLASGAGATIAAGPNGTNPLALGTAGDNSHAVQASGGGVITLGSSSLPTTIGVGGANSRLYDVSGQGSRIDATNVTAVIGGGFYGGYGAFADQGGRLTIDDGMLVSDRLFSPALTAQNGATATLTGTGVFITGDGSSGLWASQGGTVQATRVTIRAEGGIDEASGVASSGAANNGFNTTTNGGTLALTDTTIVATGASAHGVYTADGGVTTLTRGLTRVEGGNAIAIEAAAGGQVTIHGGAVETTGANGYGLLASAFNAGGSGGAPGRIVADTDEGVGLRIATSGRRAFGVLAVSGAGVTMTGGSSTTSGVQADAVYASGGSTVTLADLGLSTSGDAAKGIDVNGTGTRLDGVRLTIATTGTLDAATGFHAQGVYNGSSVPPGANTTGGGTVTLDRSTVTTSGAVAFGVDTANGGSTRFTGGSISTSGAGAIGLVATGSGTRVAVAPDSGGTATSIATRGATAHGVFASTGATVDLTGVRISTAGDGAGGLSMTGAATTVSATDAVIATTGGRDSASGLHAHAIYNGPTSNSAGGGTLTLTRTSATTGGDGIYALLTGAGGTTRVFNGQFGATGAGAHAVAALGGGFIDFSAAGATTSGDGGFGLLASGAGSQLRANGANVVTTGAGGYGIYNGAFGTSTSGGVATISASSSATKGEAAHALVTGAGVTRVETSALQTSGAGAFGVDVRDGGAVTLSGGSINTGGALAHGVHIGAGGSVAWLGQSGVTVTGAGAAGVYVEAGGAATGSDASSLIVTSAGPGFYLNGASGFQTSVALASSLTLKTTGADSAAITLSGDGATFSATGGGAITAAGKAISLLNGTGQRASFNGFTIQSLSGDLIFLDPASSTVSFTNTTANAGTGNLADVTNNSQLDLTADNSALTGVILTASGSISNVTLNNGSSWLVTGNSTTSNLTVNNSSVAFSPDGGFKTLTTGSYTGNNALITFNALLTGAGAADQLVIDGGRATGTTAIAIRTSGAPTAGFKVPLIVAVNGGSIAPNAFALSGPVTAGGFNYTLQSQDGGEYLVASQALSPQQATGSLANVAQSKETQAITTRVLTSILTGATEQINCSSCSSGFASFGSFAFGVHGRWTLNQNVSLLAGVSFDNFQGKGVNVNGALIGALGLRYDAVQLGKFRPFVEAGLAFEPWASVTYRRSYLSALGESVGVGTAVSRSATVYGRAGYIWRLSRTDELAAYTSLSRSWTWTSGYSESATTANPFGAQMASTLDRMNIWTVGAQATHLFGQHIEGNLSAAYARAFGANYGASAQISGFGAASALAPTGFDWIELGGRVSYRFSKTFVADAFVLGTLGAEPAGKQIHGGLALRMAF